MKIEDKTTGSIWIDLATKRRLEKEKEGKNKPWHCLKCGKCCTFIVIPVKRELDLETEMYLMAHGIAHDGKKIIVPAVCKYLGSDNKCRIHTHKFGNCRLGGQKECEEAQKAWKLLEEMEK